MMEKCQECKEAAALYQCPRCSRRTCSLRCCNVHKERMGCNGKRDRTTYQRLEDMNDKTLQSDFHFLEDVLNTVDVGKRLSKKIGATSTSIIKRCSHHPLLQEEHTSSTTTMVPPPTTTSISNNRGGRPISQKLKRLLQESRERDITLLVMPPGMQRHKSNTSHYNVTNGIIFWRLEFIIHMSSTDSHKKKNKVVFCKKVSEECHWIEEYNHLWGGDKGMNGEVCSNHIFFLMKKIPFKTYIELDRKITLRQILKGMTIIEYPTIEVVTSDNMHNFPRSIQVLETQQNAVPPK